MSAGQPGRQFRPDPATVIRGSVSCLTLGAIAGAVVATGLFSCVAALVLFSPV